MALVEINADVKLLTRELARIANALELMVKAQWGIDLRELDAPADAPDAGVTYADDETTAVREADAEARRLGLKAPAEDEE